MSKQIEKLNMTIARKSDIIAKRDSTIADLKQDKAALRDEIRELKANVKYLSKENLAQAKHIERLYKKIKK